MCHPPPTVNDKGKDFNVEKTAARVAAGLGLANMRNLAVAGGGKFDVSSKVGEGTLVSVIVPLAKSGGAEDIPEERARLLRLAVVDDHPLVRQGIAYLFSVEANVEIAGEAGSVEEGLNLIRQKQPDLVLRI
ncbi:MAG: hypothetical protein ACOX8W_05825 [bacterium]|jgi:hypothetical protein